MRILLAEDDELLGAGLRAGLAQQGFAVDWVRDGVAAEREALLGHHEVLLLDLGLPRQDGMTVLEHLRAKKSPMPVLVLTARDAIPDRIAGLDGGADDYLVKPVDLHELAARLRALVRRAHGQTDNRLRCGRVSLDPTAQQVWLHDAPGAEPQLVDLSSREFGLLHVFMRHQGHVLSREQLEQQLYAWGTEVQSNAVEVHIYHLRRKLGAEVIETRRGLGYVMPKVAAV